MVGQPFLKMEKAAGIGASPLRSNLERGRRGLALKHSLEPLVETPVVVL